MSWFAHECDSVFKLTDTPNLSNATVFRHLATSLDAEVYGNRRNRNSSAQGFNVEILIADDDPVVRHLLGSVLKAGGFEVSAVESGQAAIAFFEQRLSEGKDFPDAVLLDLQLMDMTGSEVLQHIRKAGAQSRVPVLILSANKEDEVLRQFPDLSDADGFLEKPFPPDQVLAAIKAATEK